MDLHLMGCVLKARINWKYIIKNNNMKASFWLDLDQIKAFGSGKK